VQFWPNFFSPRRALAVLAIGALLLGCDVFIDFPKAQEAFAADWKDLFPAIFAPPKAQDNFTSGWRDFLTEYEEALASNNSDQERAVNKRLDAYFGQPRVASRWFGQVQSVTRAPLGIGVSVRVAHEGIGYLLVALPAGSALSTKVEKLRKGDAIVFSGQTGQELSLTDRGRATEPLIAVQLTKID
jgi:hypothetical protein